MILRLDTQTYKLVSKVELIPHVKAGGCLVGVRVKASCLTASAKLSIKCKLVPPFPAFQSDGVREKMWSGLQRGLIMLIASW